MCLAKTQPLRKEPFMKVPAKGTPLRQRMIEDMGIRNLSPATQYNYVNCVAKYALHFGKSPAVLGPEHIRGYQVHLTQVKRVSWSVFNTAVCALRFLYRITLQKDWAVEHIPYPKKPKRLPEVLSLDEVWRFLDPHDRIRVGTAHLRSRQAACQRHRFRSHGHPSGAGKGTKG